jgi:hypothetical protein
MKGAPGPDSNETVTGLGCGLSLRLISPHLLAARAHRGADTVHAGRSESGPGEPVAAPLSTELWHCTAYPGRPGSHLGSTLKPGGAVLTLGVSRHLRSVACIRADASPSEVLASVIVPPRLSGVNSTWANSDVRRAEIQRSPTRSPVLAQQVWRIGIEKRCTAMIGNTRASMSRERSAHA